MPHDHPHHHGHHHHHHPQAPEGVQQSVHTHVHTNVHTHAESHSAQHLHGPGHNHAHAGHLHSHPHTEEGAADLQVLTAQFVDGFLGAADKTAYLRLMGVPFERPGKEGPTALKLVDVELTTDWQVGTASPSFGSRELSYLPFPGSMVRERANMALVYVSATEKLCQDLRDFLAARLAAEGRG